jgi:hypothetical protein
MKASRAERQTAVIVLKWEDLEDIANTLCATLPLLSIMAKCSDGLDRSFDSLQELRDFRNAERTAIQTLRIRARDESYHQTAHLSFDGDDTRNFGYSVDADEDLALELTDYFEQLRSRLRPWYELVATANWANALIGCIAVVGIVKVLPSLWTGQTQRVFVQVVDKMSVGEMFGIFMAGLFLSTLIETLLKPVRRKFFPTISFAFGDGLQRHANRETIRQVVFVGAGVGLLVGLITAWIV